jgi:hypothetical protein
LGGWSARESNFFSELRGFNWVKELNASGLRKVMDNALAEILNFFPREIR